MTKKERLHRLLEKIPAHVTLVAVSKYHPADLIQEFYDEGIRVFGESRPQELKEKQQLLPKDIEWHMIGNLQKNKVKYIAPFVHLIHSVDSLGLLKVIEKEGQKNKRIVPCLLQVKIATEESKAGLSKAALIELLTDAEYVQMEYVQICGIMGMATHTPDSKQVQAEFRKLKQIYEEVKHDFFSDKDHFQHLSMGMSNDYQLAIAEGSTLVRIGSAIFGDRD